jgi:hypothetical protein
MNETRETETQDDARMLAIDLDRWGDDFNRCTCSYAYAQRHINDPNCDAHDGIGELMQAAASLVRQLISERDALKARLAAICTKEHVDLLHWKFLPHDPDDMWAKVEDSLIAAIDAAMSS